ncbi:DUF4332 domain-containing protein [Luteolibacter marinus]|uniref:DUF4332 domain-containing protein n=1 Tax=Luteolibacter marinus TaxID=2776705 RepID=UPI001868F9AC|nr:DUF4332 domain-containing protein [Luteolibacter marinus]
MSELINIVGIGPDDAELLEASGWADLRALAKADVEVLKRELSAANSMLKIVPRAPDARKINRWVKAANRALDPAAPAATSKPARKPAAAAAGAPPAKPRSRRKPKIEEPPVATPVAKVEPPVEEPEPPEEPVITGPVNFEADPDVREMLALAPLAVPIPARMLAEKGIGPSEIAMAPLLNRAVGDLEVQVTVERPQRRDLPEMPGGNRRSFATASVQVADIGFTTGRRGFDPARVRTIEEAQGDAPPVRAASTKSGMDDDRIALLRAPRPETNGKRKPSSRFYIRGVLHDRPFKVWFGGLFTVLLQLSVPLALIAAPLLILSDQMPEKFDWVPSWIIVFPILVPVLGLLYALVSSGAKCRVCTQRLYVPKHCLKNRKAHHLPLLGHIGAVALHVMTFRWFNCTYCGTAIRIKK